MPPKRAESNWDVAQGAGIDELPHCETVPFALAVRERDRRRTRDLEVIGRLQVPVQWFFQPGDVVPGNGVRILDALRHAIRRVDVEGQLHVGANGITHGTDALDFPGERERAGLELHGLEAGLGELGELVGIVRPAFPHGDTFRRPRR